MKILAVADEESKYLWDHFSPDKLRDVDLILSCGDVSPQYLSFLATFSRAPVLYVHGNHDTAYKKTPPESCICVEDTIYEYGGVRVLGLGGSIRYKQGPFQYTQQEMERRRKRLWLSLRRHGGFDILLTHAPALGLNDGLGGAHEGFEAFTKLLDQYRPGYFVHGHVHLNYGAQVPRTCTYGATQVVNAYERFSFEAQLPFFPPHAGRGR